MAIAIRRHCRFQLLRRLTTPLAMSCALVATGCKSRPVPVAVPTTIPTPVFDRERNLASFDELFSRIRETYYDPSRLRAGTGGIDWDSLQTQLRPRVEQATAIEEVRTTMEEALDALGETHFAIIPGDLYLHLREPSDREAPFASASRSAEPGSVGIHVRMVDATPIVAMIDYPSPASQAGVRTGWAIEAIDADEVENAVSAMRESIGNHPMAAVRINEWIESRLLPPVGESIRVRFRSLNGSIRTIKLRSQAQPGMWESFGNLPAMNLRYSSKRLPGGIGCFSLTVFLNPPQVMPIYGEFIRENANARGIIIDLRGNPGGLGAMATGMCGYLIGEDGKKLGTMIRRDGNLQFVVNPRYPQFTGPVAVLVDEMSMSTSEIFAGGLQDLGRARVFGQQTPGAALPSTITRLANGDGLQYALADYLSASGRRLEGKGIQPDEIVPLRREALEAGQDDVIEAAMRWILEQSSKNDATASKAPNP